MCLPFFVCAKSKDFLSTKDTKNTKEKTWCPFVSFVENFLFDFGLSELGFLRSFEQIPNAMFGENVFWMRWVFFDLVAEITDIDA